ncbi:14928_t:CDS:2, partial [Dentiscutata erythropus]
DFLVAAKSHSSYSVQQLVAYLLLQQVIAQTFKRKTIKIEQNKLSADCHLMIKNIIVLEPAKASKFSYIVGWVIYKLIKSDDLTQSHPQFNSIHAYLEVLSSEKVVYERHIRSQTTNVIPGQEFLEFFYKIESLILLLFENHNEYRPNILEYICNSLLCNLSLLRSFNMLLDIASSCQHVMAKKQELKDDVRMFLYKRIVYIYMRSRQKSWRSFNNFIPEKGSSSLRENLKGMNNDAQTSPKIDKKLTLIKKTNIPTNPLLGLKQLQIWAQLDSAEELLWAFGDSATKKRKKNLISSILNHLLKGTQF